MEKFTDYYTVLGVDVNAPTEVIKKAFKHLALQYHPDVYKGEDAEARMREILLAYQTLVNPQRRRSYDLSRSEHVLGSSVPTAHATDVSPMARRDHQRSYAFPVLNDDAPAQIDLGELTYLLTPREVRKLKEEYLLLRCQYCHAVFESEQIRYEVGSLQYGDGALCPPYELFPLCPYCGKAEWCPAEEVRLWNVRDRAARIAKWRRRFGLG